MGFKIKNLWNRIIFSSKTGHVRPLVRNLLFNDQLEGRKSFRWVTHNKNGDLKKKFLNINPNAEISFIYKRQIQLLNITRNNLFKKPYSPSKEKLEISYNKDRLSELIISTLKYKSMIISFSHDNFKTVSGGVQLCVDKELKIFNTHCYDYLHIYPLNPITHLIEKNEDILVGISVNGQYTFTINFSKIKEILETLSTKKYDFTFIIHHLMGHSPEMIEELICKFASTSTYFWVHDYFALCRSYTLHKNGIRFCHAPDASSNACQMCTYGQNRIEHIDRIERIISLNNVKMVFPSKAAREMFPVKYPRLKDSIIVPHINLTEICCSDPDVSNSQLSDRYEINIAFIGTPAYHKGWDIFRHLVEICKEDQFKYTVFSSRQPAHGNYDWVQVHTTADNPHAMIDALADNKIDIVVNWPTWPETFSLATCEAIAAGTYILTNNWSGNVMRLVEEYQRGTILNSYSELVDFLTSSDVHDAVRFIRTVRQKTKFFIEDSDMTLGIMRND